MLVQNAGTPPDAELARAATAVAAEPLPPHRVLKWLARRARQLKLQLEPDAAELLVVTSGTDLGALAQELEKLAALAIDRPATRDDVAALVGVRHGETLQDFVDAALERRAADAARLLEPVLEQAGMSGVRMLTALGTALVGTALARAELDRVPPPPRLESVILNELRAALHLALTADRALKSSTVSDERGILMQLVLAWGVRAREAA